MKIIIKKKEERSTEKITECMKKVNWSVKEKNVVTDAKYDSECAEDRKITILLNA